MDSAQREISSRFMICFTVLLGAIMSTIDASIVNVAIPYMRGNLGASVEGIAWVATGYILSSVIMMPCMAFFSSRFGRKNFYMFSLFLFTLSSFLCGISWNLASIITFRVLQGVGGGVLMPMAQSILRETFPPKEQGMAMGIFGIGVVIGPAVGPVLGGWLTENYSWPWIFLINIPIGIANLWLAQRYIHDPDFLVREKGKIDWLGLIFMTVSLSAMQIVFAKGQEKGWFDSDFIIWCTVITVISFIAFIWRELTLTKPAVDLSIFKDIHFTCGTIIGAVFGLCLFSTLFLQPLFLNQLGYNAYQTGMFLMPRSLVMALVFPLAGRFYNRIGPRRLISAGIIITAATYWQFGHMSTQASGWDFLIPQMLQGVGFPLVFMSLSTAVLSTIDRPQLTAAVGLYNVTRQISGSFGIALIATLLTRGEIISRNALIRYLTPPRPVYQHWMYTVEQGLRHRGFSDASLSHASLSVLNQELFKQSQMLSFNHIFLMMSFVFILVMPLVFTLQHKTIE